VADQAAIDSIKIHLADEALDLGITDEIIGGWVDSGLTQTKSILAGWRAIAAKTVGTEDVNESGSSRTIRLHERALELVRDWQSRADAEDQQFGTLPAKQRGASRTVKRA
jgi:hypothetical protein